VGQIVEPLAFLSVLKWLEKEPGHSTLANLKSQLARPPLRGDAFEQLVILYLLRALSYPIPLSTSFKFHGTVPPWANEVTHIVGHIDDGTSVCVDILGEAPQNPGVGVVQYAADINDVLKWIENPTTTPAVLVSSSQFGPDVLVRCGNALLMGQLKSCAVGNKGCLDATTMKEALASLHPSHWFESLKPPVCPLVS